MADERTTMQQSQSEAKVARNTHGREMSALSYAAIYRQKLKEEQVRLISESKMRAEDVAEAQAKAQEKENRRLAMEERMQKEREAIAARNAAAEMLLTDVTERAAAKAAAEAARAEAAEAAEVAACECEKTPAAPVMPAVPATPTPAPRSIPAASAEVKAAKVPVSCVVEIGGGELLPTVQPDGTEVYTVKEAAESDSDVIVVDVGALNECAYREDADTDILYLSEDGELIPPTEDAPTTESVAAEDAPAPASEVQPINEAEAPACHGEPKLEQTEETERVSHRKKASAKKRDKKREARNIKEIREREEARLAEEAIRAAVENEGNMTPERAKQEENVRRLMARNEAVHLTAQTLDAEERARLEEELAETEAAEEALIRKNNEKREAQRAAFENARAAARAAEEAKLSEAAARREEQNRKRAEEREAMEASFAALADRMKTEEMQADAARAEREGVDAAKQARIAAAKAERDSERDRERLERAEDAALRDKDIKDWQRTYTRPDEIEDEADEGSPLRAAQRRASYSRQERRAVAAEAEQNRVERIKAEVALWNESETEESLYAVLPEDAETMTRRELRKLFREQIRSLEKDNRFCTKALLLSKRRITSPLAVRTGFEAIAAERRMIETMTRAIRIARLGKIRGHIRPLARRMAKEIRRENKLLKYQTKIAGYAPVACDPKMPKSVRKNVPFKLPTTLYRVGDNT